MSTSTSTLKSSYSYDVLAVHMSITSLEQGGSYLECIYLFSSFGLPLGYTETRSLNKFADHILDGPQNERNGEEEGVLEK